MIKKTLYFGNPAYLSLKRKQLVFRIPEIENNKNVSEELKKESIKTIPIEDIGVVILDNSQITITNALIEELLNNKCTILSCDKSHLPNGMILPFIGNTTQTERYRFQIESSVPLKKQLWQQTVKAKIINQANLLNSIGVPIDNMLKWADDVKSDDSENHEARAAVYYWSNIFKEIKNFIRDREGLPPNNLLNYGYAILRAIVARALVCSGLLLPLGIHHSNKYNPFCLADDIMEPYRPYVDSIVLKIVQQKQDISTLSKAHKIELLQLPVLDVEIDDFKSPLMIGVSQTTASLAQCFKGDIRKIKYPTYV